LPTTAWQTSGNLTSSHINDQSHTGTKAVTIGQSYWSDPENSGIAIGGTPPRMVVDSLGTLHIARSQMDTYGGPVKNYYFSRSPDGVWSAPVDPTGDPTTKGFLIAVDGANTLHMVWTSDSGTWSASKAAGTAWSAPLQISPEPLGLYSLAAGPDGQAHLVAYLNGLVYTHLSQGKWSPFTHLNPSAGTATLQVGPDGTVHMLCTMGVDGVGNVYYFSLPSGGTWSAAQIISSSYTGMMWPILKMDASGRLYAIWDNGY
jgi:hypothetical protein